jgi:hypothetical protein
MIRRLFLAFCLACLAVQAEAHASQQSFVLLLPTGFYIAGGALSVALTVLLVSVLPDRASLAIFRPLPLLRSWRPRGPETVSTLSFLLLLALLAIGMTGPHDPTRNPLPLAVWAIWWVALVTLQGVLGDLWRWLNPWSGPYALLRRGLGLRPLLRLPGWVGHWPALASFLAFAAVLLAHPSPADPDELAPMIVTYWLVQFAGMLLFGPKWLRRGEGLTVLLSNYASVAALGKRAGRWRLGLPGWQILARRAPGMGLAVFMVTTLAVGSFDGLHETFWWLGVLGINPMEFPGRSAVVAQTLVGVAVVIVLLLASFAATVRLGVGLAGAPERFAEAFRALAPTILPIALAYHFAHYMPSFLVDAQYALRALSDPLSSGLDWLHLGPFFVTSGFFNVQGTVRVIWLAQAGGVVAGHVVAILLSHALAVRLFGTHRKAALSQIPLAAFMVAYTLFGLWLLASPRGA